jgi:hypothetical protein
MARIYTGTDERHERSTTNKGHNKSQVGLARSGDRCKNRHRGAPDTARTNAAGASRPCDNRILRRALGISGDEQLRGFDFDDGTLGRGGNPANVGAQWLRAAALLDTCHCAFLRRPARTP